MKSSLRGEAAFQEVKRKFRENGVPSEMVQAIEHEIREAVKDSNVLARIDEGSMKLLFKILLECEYRNSLAKEFKMAQGQ